MATKFTQSLAVEDLDNHIDGIIRALAATDYMRQSASTAKVVEVSAILSKMAVNIRRANLRRLRLARIANTLLKLNNQLHVGSQDVDAGAFEAMRACLQPVEDNFRHLQNRVILDHDRIEEV